MLCPNYWIDLEKYHQALETIALLYDRLMQKSIGFVQPLIECWTLSDASGQIIAQAGHRTLANDNQS